LLAALVAASASSANGQGFVDESFESESEAALAFDGVTVAGVQFPNAMRLDDVALKLLGAGARTEAKFVMYSMGVYVVDSQLSAGEIIAADTPAILRMEMVSPLVTSRKFSEAVTSGFNKSTNGNVGPLEDEIGQFLTAVKDGLDDEDVLELHYVPGEGTHFHRNGELQATVQGLEFKQALFGIWLGENPIDVALKGQLLGARR
jgi:hypothetical protein